MESWAEPGNEAGTSQYPVSDHLKYAKMEAEGQLAKD